MASTSVVFDILANDRASSKFDHLGKSVDNSGAHLSKFAAIATKAAKAGAIALGAGAVIAAKGLYEMAQGAADDQAAHVKLASTLKATAGATKGQIASVEQWITAQGKAYGVADDDLRPALQRLSEATHSVGKSQQLASLAMDVAAAKGKPLVTVSEALMKAYNGNIGALGRLGIKTKDAKGDTITFTQAVKQMSDTFGGQAAKQADTLQGKLQRMKVEISEAGEAIGYKLLPYASDAADWLGDHLPGALDALGKKAGPVFRTIIGDAGDLWHAIKPAVDQITEALGHMADSASGTGDVFHNDLLPPIKTTADIIGGLVDAVDNLPGPIKTLGVQAGIAAVGFSYLSTGIGKAKGAMSGLIGPTATATSRMEKLQGAARSVAGIGGMLLIAHSAHTANQKLADLESIAGDTALGFAMGGPWGAAIGAVGGLAVAMHRAGKQTDWAAAAADRDRAATQRLKDALDQTTGAITTQARTAARATLVQNGSLASAHELGLTTREVIDAMMGGQHAVTKVTNALFRAGVVFDDTGHAVEQYGDANNRILKPGLTGLAELIGNVRDKTHHLQGEIRRNTKDTRDYGHTLDKVPKKVETWIVNHGILPTTHGVAKVIAKMKELAPDLKRRDIKAIIEASGVDTTIKAVMRVLHAMDDADHTTSHPKLDGDDKPFKSKNAQILADLRALDRQAANPKAGLSLDEYYRRRAELINSLHNIPDEYVNIWTIHRDGGGGGGGAGGGGSQTTPRLIPRVPGADVVDGRLTAQRTARAKNVFKGLGEAIIHAFALGINGSANQAQHAVDRMLAAITKALKDKKITEAAAKQMRDAVQAMAHEADQGRTMLAKRADFASTLRQSFASELNLGELVDSPDFAGIGSLTGGAQALATRLKAFAGQLNELRADHLPRNLIGEIASLGSDQGSRVAAAILAGSSSDEQALSNAYNQLQNAAGVASGAAANAMYGSVREIKQEFHVTINGTHLSGRELEQVLTKWAREQGRRLNFPAS